MKLINFIFVELTADLDETLGLDKDNVNSDSDEEFNMGLNDSPVLSKYKGQDSGTYVTLLYLQIFLYVKQNIYF